MHVRKAEVAKAIRKRMKELGAITQLQIHATLSKGGLSISQPTLSRLLRGEYEGMPASLIHICEYSKIPMNNFLFDVEPKSSQKLLNALQVAWDGSPQREAFLARVIKAAGKLSSSNLAKNEIC
jgi:transcriptional regulator with XRE-family HTH domain